MATKTGPQSFVGSSSTPVKAPVPPPPEIIRATAASLESMLGMCDAESMPEYVSDGVKSLAASLDRWASDIEHPPAREITVTVKRSEKPAIDPVLPEAQVENLPDVPSLANPGV